MSDDIEIPEVDTDEIIETSDEENSVARTVAVAATGMVAGVGIWYGAQKLTKKLEAAAYRHWEKKVMEDNTDPDQKE